MDRIERKPGPRARRVIATLNAEWDASTVARAQIATELRAAARALDKAADGYDHGTMRDVAVAIAPVIGILASLVNAVRAGHAIRRDLDRRDAQEN